MHTVEGVAISIPPHDDSDLRLPCLDRAPERVADDPLLGDRHDLPALLRIGSGHPLARARVFDLGAPVPFQPPGMERVVQDAGAPVRPPADRGAFDVQPPGDCPWTHSGYEQLEDAPDHGGFGQFDAPLACAVRGRGQHLVPWALPPGILPLSARPSWPRLVFSARSLSCIWAMVPSMPTCMGVTGRYRVQPDAQEAQPVMELGDVRELAAEPVEGLRDDDLETARFGVDQNLLELLPGPAGHRFAPPGTGSGCPRVRP